MNEQSLEQIEQQSWGDPPDGSSRLIATVHELRRKPVGHLTAEDLRVLLSQRVGVDTLMPYRARATGEGAAARGRLLPR